MTSFGIDRNWIVIKLIVIIAVFSLLAIGCGGSSGGGGDDDGGDTGGDITVEAEATIGPEGGTIEVTDPESLLYGSKLIFSENTLSDDLHLTISIGQNYPDLPFNTSLIGNVIDIDAGDIIFKNAVQLVLPYPENIVMNGEGNLKVYTFNENILQWEIAFIDRIDTDSNLVYCRISHCSYYLIAEDGSCNGSQFFNYCIQSSRVFADIAAGEGGGLMLINDIDNASRYIDAEMNDFISPHGPATGANENDGLYSSMGGPFAFFFNDNALINGSGNDLVLFLSRPADNTDETLNVTINFEIIDYGAFYNTYEIKGNDLTIITDEYLNETKEYKYAKYSPEYESFIEVNSAPHRIYPLEINLSDFGFKDYEIDYDQIKIVILKTSDGSPLGLVGAAALNSTNTATIDIEEGSQNLSVGLAIISTIETVATGGMSFIGYVAWEFVSLVKNGLVTFLSDSDEKSTYYEIDEDFDGFYPPIDWDDDNNAIYPGAAEICNDEKDNNQNGSIDCEDSDCQGDPNCSSETGIQIQTYYFQYRNRPDYGEFRGFIQLQKDGGLIQETDVSDIEMKDNYGNKINIDHTKFFTETPLEGTWNASNSSATFVEKPWSGFSLYFDQSAIDTGKYSYHVTTNEGDILTTDFYFPEKLVLPAPELDSMQHEVLSNGDLSLTWNNPSGAYDELRVSLSCITGQQEILNDILEINLPKDKDDLIIPKVTMDKLSNLYDPLSFSWIITTRAISPAGMNYARGYSKSGYICWSDCSQPQLLKQSCIPSEGSVYDANILHKIELHFSEQMTGAYSYGVYGGNVNIIDSQWSNNTTTFTFYFDNDLISGTEYTVLLNPDSGTFRDIAGNPLPQNTTLNFTQE